MKKGKRLLPASRFDTHRARIILLTKLLAKKDLNFYDFSAGTPVHNLARTGVAGLMSRGLLGGKGVECLGQGTQNRR